MNLPAIGLERFPFLADERHGPLPPLLLALTMVTGLVDAISVLKLGNVFVANMTGNVAFLGFAVAGAGGFSIAAAATAVAAFMVGALLGGRLALVAGHHRGRHLTIATWVNVAIVCIAMVFAALTHDAAMLTQYGLIVLLATAMGIQNATARCLSVPDLTTTVLTQTLSGLAADSIYAGGTNPNPVRRLMVMLMMFAGALIGAIVVLRAGMFAALACVLVMLVLVGSIGIRISASTEAWTMRA